MDSGFILKIKKILDICLTALAYLDGRLKKKFLRGLMVAAPGLKQLVVLVMII
jgi:hypothetical protein